MVPEAGMSPTLYAFVASSGPAGVSRLAVAAWARAQGAHPGSVLTAVDRAARRGLLATRPGPPATRGLTVVYVVARREAVRA